MEILKNKNNILIIKNDNKVSLASYETLIAIFNETTKTLKLDATYWDYSKTTLKHLKEFINNYTCFNYETKKDFEKEIKNNDNIIEIINLK